ncbi:MAG: CopD family protein [Geobacteraceae bacterium]
MIIPKTSYLTVCLIALLTFGAILLLPGLSPATEEYAQQTGQSCEVCHVDPFGGGELTSAGKAYQSPDQPATTGAKSGTPKRLFRLGVGFLHIVTGFFWFGTILYVHLVLKPKYAVGGLPKGEMLIGLVSMSIMAVTGVLLTHYRVSSLEMLFQSRFGTLLVIKIVIFITMVATALFAVFIIAPRLRRKKPQQAATGKSELTVAELSQFDGKEGRPAYFAYNGQVFDGTASKLWKNGRHMGRHSAGEDLTGVLKLAPHGEEKILELPVAATLAGKDGNAGMTPPQKVFYLLAYLNLTAVLGILLILSLWRWW